MRSVSIFGATGSVGESAFDLLMGSGGPAQWRTVALTGGRNVARLARMARALHAELAVIADETLLPALQEALAGTGIEAAGGRQAVIDAADRPADWVLSAIVGAAGLAPGLRVAERGGVLALANKESLVAAGPLLMGAATRAGATILPVDSEHSAIFQCLERENIDAVERVTITASGGAFRDWPLERLSQATVAEASRHPNWDMGQRITIDSASMFNKALEVIEAHEFFALPAERIEVLVHPESIVHAMVGYADGGTLAHLGPPDMRHAIGHALHWPRRKPLGLPRLDLAALGSLTFRTPCETRWPALGLARQVIAAGGAAGAVFNAAKEQALDDFIAGRIRFTDMAPAVDRALTAASGRAGFAASPDSLGAVLDWDGQARRDAAADRDHAGRGAA
ncbi:1-deoxy-D-xylulose-5-phosphate reductoisomerase [Paracoccus endophyticus]|uniref:1-deoxy-D-xylulose-5-phosphate reductoisomerase n=1 Tax=Paracoccus endophyticus TaxID=2233774 RepID=UPI000DDB06E9|nr:1-deoxy-D-xylulose-5-phosphate reductoisomerase [Paracoccus endophyticus]